MRRELISPKNVTYREVRHLAEPSALTTIILCIYLIFYAIRSLAAGESDIWPLFEGIGGVLYSIALFFAIVKTPSKLQRWRWTTALTNALCVATGLIFLPVQLRIIPQMIMILIAAITVILWDRMTAYVFLFLTIGFHLLFSHWVSVNFSLDFLNDSTLVLLGLIIVETIHRLTEANQMRIQRLESLNEFARKIVYSLETDEVLALVGAAIQNAIRADTYFLGIAKMDDETIQFDLIFDDGEFFPPSSMPIEGTLSGWVIRNKRSLFIPDMRHEDGFEGFKTILIGKKKNNLSWMGVPMHAEHINGVVSVGSYTPNSFDRTDFELLENLVQHAALALDNAFHHAEVEAQSHTDSLTNVYNHNYIVEILRREAERTRPISLPMSLIMLDVDHFKQYNDHYGHIIGDQVLILLAEAIRTHINSTDSVGRWGGEEFAVILPNANGEMALNVARRIQRTMNTLMIQDRDGKDLPAPTVSQGIAVFPNETSDIHKLIDLADQRLYIAKERGRNQVEPQENHWEQLVEKNGSTP